MRAVFDCLLGFVDDRVAGGQKQSRRRSCLSSSSDFVDCLEPDPRSELDFLTSVIDVATACSSDESEIHIAEVGARLQRAIAPEEMLAASLNDKLPEEVRECMGRLYSEAVLKTSQTVDVSRFWDFIEASLATLDETLVILADWLKGVHGLAPQQRKRTPLWLRGCG